MGRWSDWRALENAQAKADAEGIGPRPERPVEPPKPANVDQEAAAAIAEATSLAWPHPIEPTLSYGPQPTNADGTPREGWWKGSTWVDGQRPPPDIIEGIRAWARAIQRDLRNR